MILVAGGTGVLGTRLVTLLASGGIPVRVMTRDPGRAAHLRGANAEIVQGDVRDRADVRHAMSGATVVVSAIQGFGGTHAAGVQQVDGAGNSNLISEAAAAGVEHFVLTSVQAADAHHPMELFRVKYAAERLLTSSRLAWTIIRPTAFMETWISLLGGLSRDGGAIRVFGHGENPINFVSARDVANVVALAITDASLRSEIVDVAGPENLTFNQFAHIMQAATGDTGPIRHVPRAMMRAAALMLRPIRPTVAAQIAAGLVMDTHPMAYDPATATRRLPDLPTTTLAELTLAELTVAKPPHTSRHHTARPKGPVRGEPQTGP